MKNKKIMLPFLAVMSMVFVLNVSGQTSEPSTNVSKADQKFILAAAQGGMTEVTLGALAIQKGTRDDVKQFGQMMVTDHMAINANLKVLATLKNVTLPASLDEKHQAMVDEMTALPATKFDDAYIAAMIKDHKKDIKEFKSESGSTEDENVKTFADKSIPFMEEHLKHVTAMKK